MLARHKKKYLLEARFFELAAGLYEGQEGDAFDKQMSHFMQSTLATQDPYHAFFVVMLITHSMYRCLQAGDTSLVDMADYKKNLELLGRVPYEDTSISSDKRLVLSYLFATRQIMLLPQSLKNLNILQCENAMGKAQQVIMLVYSTLSFVKSNQFEYKALAQSVNGFINHIAIDEQTNEYKYTTILLSELQHKLLNWLQDFDIAQHKLLKKSKITMDVLNEMKQLDVNINNLLQLLRLTNYSQCKEANKRLSNVDIINEKTDIKLFSPSALIKSPKDAFKIAATDLQLRFKSIEFLMEELSLRRIDSANDNMPQERNIHRFLLDLYSRIKTAMCLLHYYREEFTEQSIAESFNELLLYEQMIAGMFCTVNPECLQLSWMREILSREVSVADSVAFLSNDWLLSIFSQFVILRLQYRQKTASDENRISIFKEMKESLLRVQAELLELNGAAKEVRANFIFDMYYLCLINCKNSREREIFVDGSIEKTVFLSLHITKCTNAYRMLYVLLVQIKKPGQAFDTMTLASFKSNELKFLQGYAQKAASDVLQNHAKINSYIDSVFFKFARMVLGASDEFKSDLADIDRFIDYVASKCKDKNRELALNNVLDNSRSFLLGLSNPDTGKVSRSQTLTTTSPAIVTYKPEIAANADFSHVRDHFKGNYNQMRAFYQKIFDSSRHEKDRIYGLLGLLECLRSINNPDKSRRHAILLDIRAPEIFADFLKMTDDKQRHRELKARYDQLIKPWLAQTVKVVQKPAPVAQEEVVTAKKMARKKHIPRQVQTLKTRVRVQTAAIDYVINQPKSKPNVNHLVDFTFTKSQLSIIEYLKAVDGDPHVHGSSTVQRLHLCEPRDVDLLCFLEINTLVQYFTKNQSRYNIENIKYFAKLFVLDGQTHQFNIIILTFKEIDANKQNVTLDLLCLGECEPEKRMQMLQKLITNYGMGFLLAKPDGRVVDPSSDGRYLKKAQRRVFDIANPSVRNHYMTQHPVRFFDLVNKLAYFKENNKPFNITFALCEELVDMLNKDVLSKPVVNTILFDKLFLQDHTGSSIYYLHNQFNVMQKIFPMFEYHMQDLLDVFYAFAKRIQQDRSIVATGEKRHTARVELLSHIALAYMKHRCDLEGLKQYEYEFSLIAQLVLQNSCFKFNSLLVMLVQAKAWEMLNNGSYLHPLPAEGSSLSL